MEKHRRVIPTWDVASLFVPVSSFSQTRTIRRSPIMGKIGDLIDDTPPYKGSKVVAKPKKLKKKPLSDFDKWRLKHKLLRKGIMLENKTKVIRLTRKKNKRVVVPTISFGRYRKSVKLTRFVDHFQGEFYPREIIGNEARSFFTNDRCAYYYGTDGTFKVEHPAYYYEPGVTAQLINIKKAVIDASKDFRPDVEVVQRIVKNALPRPEDFFPACNLIAVLVELRPTLNMAKDTLSALRNILKNLTKGNRSVGNALENAAELRLWANFGVSPTASDVAALLGLLLHFRDLVQSYNKLAQIRVHTVHRTIYQSDLRLDYSQGANIIGVDKPFVNNYFSLGPVLTNREAHVVGRLTVKIRLKPLSHTWAERVLQKLLGFDDILAGLWEGVPFSWLVDYFTNMSELIEYYTSTDLIMPYEILDASYSWAVEGTAIARQNATVGYSPLVTQRQLRKNGKVVFQPGETVHNGYSFNVQGIVDYDFKYYHRTNVKTMCEILASLPGIDPLYFKVGIPSLNQTLNAASVGYLKARGKKNTFTKGV